VSLILLLHVRDEHGALGPEPIFTGAFVVIGREADRALVSLVSLFHRGSSLMVGGDGEIYTVRGLQLEGAGAFVVIASEADRADHFDLGLLKRMIVCLRNN
jgi:hypothetical protein